jgi:hypothetical protein
MLPAGDSHREGNLDWRFRARKELAITKQFEL